MFGSGSRYAATPDPGAATPRRRIDAVIALRFDRGQGLSAFHGRLRGRFHGGEAMINSRAAVATGLGLVGVALLVGPSLGQNDAAVTRSNTTATNAAPAPKPPAVAVIGTIDLGAVMKGYDKAKFLYQEFEGAYHTKANQLMKLQSERQQEMEMIEKVTPGGDEFKKRQERLSKLKAEFEAGREQAQSEFMLRESEIKTTLYTEVQEMVSRVAYSRKMNLVIRYSNDPISATNTDSVMAAMSRTVMYTDPQNDLTRDVVYFLNVQYKKLGGTAPKEVKEAKAAPANAAPGTRLK
jgi:Skp family chaperone for outer membrane proteins